MADDGFDLSIPDFNISSPAPSEGASFGGGYNLGVSPVSSGAFGVGGLDASSLPSAPPIAEPSGFDKIASSLAGGRDASGKDQPGLLGGIGSFAKGALPFAQMGLGALGVKNAMDAQGAARQQASILHRQQENQQRATAPLVAFGEQQLNRSAAGTINPAIQARIDQWAQAQKIKARQLFAHGHITDSTMMNSVLADIDAKAEAMAAGDVHLMEQEGVSALQAASGAATAGAGTAQREQSQLDELISEANKALASLSGQQ